MIPHPAWPIFSKRRNNQNVMSMNFIDDLSVAVKIDMKEDLVDEIGRAISLTYET